MIKIASKVVTLLITLFVLTSCQNTAAGFGQDLQNTGQAITKAVKN